MKLDDQDILSVYNTIKEQGHPDPVGFIARSDILSGLDNSFSKKDRVGVTGVKRGDADRIESNNVDDTVGNLAAAVKLDLDNFKNFKDVSNMHVAFESGGEAVADRSKRPKRFLRELSKAKVRWDKRIKELEKFQQPLKNDKSSSPVREEASSSLQTSEIIDNNLQAPIIESTLPKASSLVDVGNASKLDELRGAFKNSALAVTNSGIPEKKISKARTNLRNLIRKAVKNA